jgi:ParB family chromosome partitioning protein
MDAPVSCVKIPLDQITIPPGHRDVGHLELYLDSLRQVPLLQPILVTPDGPGYGLVAGVRRLEAARHLMWAEIPAIILKLDGLHEELATIDENLIRQELTVLERAESLRRRKEIYEQLHPETAPRGGPGRGHRGKRRNDFASFAQAMAGPMGYTARTVQQEVEIATKLSDAVKTMIRPLPVANRKVDLRRLAQLPPEAQEAVARQLASGAATTVTQATRMGHVDGEQATSSLTGPQAPQGHASALAPAVETPHALSSQALVHLIVGHLIQAPTVTEEVVDGRPAAEVLAERLAALPRPELVLLAGCVTGTREEAFRAWAAAVGEACERRPDAATGHTRQHVHGEGTGTPEQGCAAGTDLGHALSTQAQYAEAREVRGGADTDVVSGVHTTEARVPPRLVAKRMVQRPDLVPSEAGRGAEHAFLQDQAKPEAGAKPLIGPPLELPRSPLPPLNQVLLKGERHDVAPACPPGIGTPAAPPPPCPKCASSQVWKIFEAGSGRIACLACAHHFLPTERPLTHATWQRTLIETLEWCYVSKASGSEPPAAAVRETGH